MNILITNGILSAPVIRPDSTCAGVIDLSLIVSAAVHRADQTLQLLSDAIDTSVTVDAVVSQSAEYLFPFFEHNPLSVLMDVFASGIHRVTLISETYELIAPCSQSDMIALINKYFRNGLFPHVAAMTVDALELGQQNIVRIESTATLRRALHTLSDEHVSSVAIIEPDTGMLIGDVSASSLRGLNLLQSFELDIVTFLASEHPASLCPKCIGTGGSLSELLNLLSENRSHRVWILDDSARPLHVVTITDILRLLGTGRIVSSREANGDVSVHTLWKMLDPTEFSPLQNEYTNKLKPIEHTIKI